MKAVFDRWLPLYIIPMLTYEDRQIYISKQSISARILFWLFNEFPFRSVS